MLHQTYRLLGAAALLMAAYLAQQSTATAATPPVFSNFYVGPPGVPAQLYVAPLPTPPLVGHTWITYQPLDPHEFLYHHKRTYYRYHPTAGQTRTTIHWY